MIFSPWASFREFSVFSVLSFNLFGVSFKLKPILQYSQTSCYEYAFINYIIIQIIIHIVYSLLNWKMSDFLEYSSMLSNFYPMGILRISSDRDDPVKAKIKTKKIPGPKFNPQKIPCRISKPEKFPESMKINDITRKIETLVMECFCLFIHHTIWSKNLFRIWWSQNNHKTSLSLSQFWPIFMSFLVISAVLCRCFKAMSLVGIIP